MFWGHDMISRLVKLIFFLILLGLIALLGFAYLGDLTPGQVDVRESVTIETN